MQICKSASTPWSCIFVILRWDIQNDFNGLIPIPPPWIDRVVAAFSAWNTGRANNGSFLKLLLPRVDSLDNWTPHYDNVKYMLGYDTQLFAEN